jgi:hypothetical protein
MFPPQRRFPWASSSPSHKDVKRGPPADQRGGPPSDGTFTGPTCHLAACCWPPSRRRLHDRAHTLGFTDLDSYLVTRCQQDASLIQLAGELDATIDVVRRLVALAGIQRSSPKVRSARSRRRRATDQHLTERAAQLGFADLGAYLAGRVTQWAWTLVQVAGELGIHPGTVSDRLDRHGLRRPGQAVR